MISLKNNSNFELMTFDERGNLVEPVELTIAQFRETFVDKWQGNRSTRPAIFDVFETYVSDFRNLITPNFVMWIDGSFVTLKKDNPNDIDFVSFIDYRIYDEKKPIIDSRFGKYTTKDHYGKLLDAYICLVFPSTHENAIRTQSDELDWLRQFSYTKPDRHKRQYPKSFVKIKFTEND
jgi:hypothetical protein